MSIDSLWAVIGAVVGILALGVTVYIGVTTNRRQFPKRRLSFLTSSRTLVSDQVPLEVTFQGKPVRAPELVELTVISDSRADIPSSSFDAQRPIIFNLSSPIIAVLNSAANVVLGGTDNSITIEPQLIRPGTVLEVTLLVEQGSMELSVENPLVDIQVLEVNDYGDLRSKDRGLNLFASTVGVFSMAIIAAVLVTAAATPVVAVLSNALELASQISTSLSPR